MPCEREEFKWNCCSTDVYCSYLVTPSIKHVRKSELRILELVSIKLEVVPEALDWGAVREGATVLEV